MCRKSGSMRLPCQTVGRVAVSRSAIFQSRQFGQQLLAAGGLVHTLHHLSGRRELRSKNLTAGCRLRRVAHGRLVFVLAVLLCAALLAVHRCCCGQIHAGLLCGNGFREFIHHMLAGTKVVAVQTKTFRRAFTQCFIQKVHQKAALAAQGVGNTGMLALLFAIGCRFHVPLCRLHAVDVVRIQRGKFKFLSTKKHIQAPFIWAALRFCPEENYSRHKKSPFRVWSGDCVRKNQPLTAFAGSADWVAGL
nr:MAG TPA: hypothetical protein [Caudoviricetes sp.]